jgi:5-methylcytosine-specific restriction endonuclease McrA
MTEHFRHSKHITRGRRWTILRLEAMARDGYKCRSCGKPGRLEVDHILPVRLAPDRAYDLANLQCLCPACHTRKTRVECGHPEKSPARSAWDSAVAELATASKPNPKHKGTPDA